MFEITIDLFKKSHPFIFNTYSVLIPSIISFFIIVILAPFHFQEFDLTKRSFIGLLTAITVALAIFISVQFLKKVFPKIMLEDNWTIGKEFSLILFVLCIISFLISIMLYSSGSENYNFSNLIFETMLITLGIGIFPVLILVLFEQYQHQKKQFKKAAALNVSLQLKKDINQDLDSSNTSLLLKSDKGKIELQLSSLDLAYVQSDGNYVEIYYFNQGQIQKKLIRNTLKNIERILPSQIFIRCHNRFVINGNFIQKVEGNARNLNLYLKETPNKIPVSRSKVNTITEFLENLS
ncbi:hypothetical protein GCM10010831_13200 [Psychroflexus salis]|uniref:HTH LytTR-type domain-containing protein n=1 Tax=Psychroflexus salis TaxID=1526574 RepID=A0A917E981_9FLAO|nr:hypothetical protein GCM10010831_13200 [Psychroflexus salis]